MNQISELIKKIKDEGNQNLSIKIDISSKTQKEIEQYLNIDLTGYVFEISLFALRHIIKRHNNEKIEAARNQVVITNKELEKIPLVIEQFDFCYADGKNKIGKDVFVFVKNLGNRYIIIKEIRTGRKTISLDSMRIVKIKKRKTP